jgi:D-tyrosyl-tRNA(Tyr) deacylase
VRAVVQRVSEARVRVDGEVVGEIGQGLCVLLGVSREDGEDEAARLAEKVAKLRIFENEDGRFDRSLLDAGGDALVVSQFTLIADTAKGTDQASPRPRLPRMPSACTSRSAQPFASLASASTPAASARGWRSSS